MLSFRTSALLVSIFCALAALPHASAASSFDELGIAQLVSGTQDDAEPSYDHQTKTYIADHVPANVTDADFNLTPFFSPDHSTDSLTKLVQSAKETIDIATPGWSSWGTCTRWKSQSCVGCLVKEMANETFPIFNAVLNAVHQRNVKVRVLTNNYNEPSCPGRIAPLEFLSLNGVEVRYFSTVTFMHAKFIMIDGKKVSISSVNFSKTSFTLNREAGMIIDGSSAEPLVAMVTSVFESDYAQGTPFEPSQKYNQTDMGMILDPSERSVDLPGPFPNPDAYVSPLTTVGGSKSFVEVFASPDSAYDQLLADLDNVKSSFHLHIYQVTDDDLCDKLLDLHNQKGIDFKLLVSAHIYDTADWKLAQACYKRLYNAGVSIRATPDYYRYSHQKYYVRDGDVVFMSTGNWSPTDFPSGSDKFVPYNQSGWRKTNRDFNMFVHDANVASIFAKVLDGDFQRGSDWHPYGSASVA